MLQSPVAFAALVLAAYVMASNYVLGRKIQELLDEKGVRARMISLSRPLTMQCDPKDARARRLQP